jgi:hypothetical protein
MRTRLLNLALRAYPLEVRNSNGAEMLGTALDLSDGSVWMLLGESLALLGDGIAARAGIAAAVSPRQLAADVCAQATTVWGAVSLVASIQLARAADLNPNTAELAYTVLLAMAIGFALLGYDRLGGICGLAWIFVLHLAVIGHPAGQHGGSWEPLPLKQELLELFLPLAGYLVMMKAPRSRSPGAKQMLWLICAVALVLTAPSFVHGIGTPTLVVLATLIAGLMRLPVDPRLAFAGVTVVIVVELSRWAAGERAPASTPLTWAFYAVPLLLGACAARLYTARGQSSR